MASPYRDISISVATLAHGPTAALVSVAAVAFDVKTGKLGGEFHQNIDFESVIRKGVFDIDADQLKWWLENPRSASALFDDSVQSFTLATVLDQLASWYRGLGDCGRVWGTRLGTLDYAYRKGCVGLRRPWGRSNMFDLDTLRHIAQTVAPGTPQHHEPTHTAIAHARMQAIQVVECLALLTAGSAKPASTRKSQSSQQLADDGEL